MPMPSIKRVASIIVALLTKAPAPAPMASAMAVIIRLFFAPSFARMPPAGNASTTPISENTDITQPIFASVKPSSEVNSVANKTGALNWQNAARTPTMKIVTNINQRRPIVISEAFSIKYPPSSIRKAASVPFSPILQRVGLLRQAFHVMRAKRGSSDLSMRPTDKSHLA